VDFAISVLDQSITEAVRQDLPFKDLLPANRYTRKYMERQRGEWSLRRIFSKLYETSPERWIKKINGIVAK
jgi:hypothetical protein